MTDSFITIRVNGVDARRCGRCSTRTLAVAIPLDEWDAHTAEHDAAEQEYADAVTALDAHQAETGDPMSSPDDDWTEHVGDADAVHGEPVLTCGVRVTETGGWCGAVATVMTDDGAVCAEHDTTDDKAEQFYRDRPWAQA